MVDTENLIFLAGIHADVETAKQDYQAIKDLYYETNTIDAFDAAVLEKQDTGKVKIVRKHARPNPDGALAGAGWGLATGLAVALFPSAAVGTGFLVGGVGASAVLGAISGHVAAGLGRKDLLALGEMLDSAEAGLIAATTVETALRVRQVMSEARLMEVRQAVVDTEELEKDIRDAYREAVATS